MRQPSEEEIQALEAEMAKLTVDDVLLQTVVTLLNLGARKAGLAEGTTADLPQVKLSIDAARALVPLLEPVHGEHLGPVREALSRLQMAYVAADRAAKRRRRPARRRPRRVSRRPTRAAQDRRRAPAGSGFRGSEGFRPSQAINSARSSGSPAGLPLWSVLGSAVGRTARFLDLERFP